MATWEFEKTMWLLASLAVAGASASTVRAETNCAPFKDSCNYYLCRESIQPCSDEGYFIRFGYTYCSGFLSDVQPRMSAEGAKWMNQIAHCLRDKLDDIDSTLSCEDTESAAIASHSPCYIGTGFCDLSFLDKFRILEYVYKELEDHRMRKVMFQIELQCTEQGRLL
jgi:hypothetical protein